MCWFQSELNARRFELTSVSSLNWVLTVFGQGGVFWGVFSAVLHLPPYFPLLHQLWWLMGRLRGPIRQRYGRMLQKLDTPGSCLQSSLQLLALISFYRLIFLPPFSASTPCLLSSFTLAPYVSLDGTLGRRFVHTPPLWPLSLSARASVVVCLPSAEVSFLTELRRKDCFSCVYTGTSRSHRTARSMTQSLSQAGALSNDRILRLILVQFHLSSFF